jgi:hypothetical protein
VGRRGTDLCISCLKQFGPELDEGWMQSDWLRALVSIQRAEEYRESQANVVTIEGMPEHAMTPLEPVQSVEDIIEELARLNPSYGSTKLLATLKSLGYATSRSTIDRTLRRMREEVGRV